jgi:two-component system, LytTR family, sensor kinase
MDFAMPERAGTRIRWPIWLSGLALFYTGVALVLATQDYLLAPKRGLSVPWLGWVVYRFTQWFVWTGWTPFVVWLGGRYRLDREPRLRNRAVHVAAMIVMVPVVFMSDILLSELLSLPGSGRTLADKFLENFRVPAPLLLGWLLIAALTWIAVLTLSYAWRYRKEALEASRLQAELAEAQLHALKSQLHPHFLFNALNAVVTLTTSDPPAAKRVVILLSDLLRRALADAEVQEVPLAREIEFARSYLEIEQVRFPNRLLVEVSLDPRAEQALVPHLVLQPLVENAVRHGIGPKAGPGTVWIEAGLDRNAVRLSVVDDGVGPSVDARSRGAGVGLSNVRARLARLYGDRASLDCGARPGGGFAALVRVPLRADGPGTGAGAAPENAT